MQARLWAVLVAGGLGALLLALCTGAGRPLVIDFGHPDSASFEGMRPERGRGGRWSRPEAAIAPGLVALGEAEVTLVADRGSRTLATLRVTLGQQERVVAVGAIPVAVSLAATGPVRVELAAETTTLFGVRLQSLVVRPRGSGALAPSAGLAARMAAGSGLLAFAFILAGLAPSAAAAASVLLWSLPAALFGWENPWVTVRLVDTLWLIAPLFAFVLAGFKKLIGTKAVLVGVSASLLRLMLLFHPNWYYGDIEIHLNVARVLKEEGRVHGWMNMYALQQRFDLGRASVSGGMRPLPYPPFFHTISSFAPDGAEVPAMKALGVAAETATILLTMLLAMRLLGGERGALMAGLVVSFMPFELLELFRVSFPAILGRTLDLGAIVWLASGTTLNLGSVRARVTLGAWLGLCCLSYNASPVHFGLFIPLALLALSLPPSRFDDARGLLAAALVGALISLVFYGRYLMDVALNVIRENRVESSAADWMKLVGDLVGQHGPVFVAALLAAPMCVRGLWGRRESRFLLAWILWIPLAALVAALLPGPFFYFRTEFFAYPLFAILCARWANAPAVVMRALVGASALWGIFKTAAFIPGLYLTHSGRIGD